MKIFAVSNYNNYNRYNSSNPKNKVNFGSGFEKNISEGTEELIRIARKKWIGDGPGNEWQNAKLEQEIEQITGGYRKMSEKAKKVLEDADDVLWNSF